MATEPKVDKQLEHQLEVVKELSRDPAAQHPGEVPTAPLTEHGETSGLKPLVAYRMQLFLYAKESGAADIGPAECWVGVSPPKAS